MIVYARQKSADRKHDLLTKRRSVYEEYLCAYIATSSNLVVPESNPLLRINIARMRLALVASDEVMLKSAALDDYVYRVNSDDRPELPMFIADVVSAMRKDVFDATRLSKEVLLQAVPMRYQP